MIAAAEELTTGQGMIKWHDAPAPGFKFAFYEGLRLQLMPLPGQKVRLLACVDFKHGITVSVSTDIKAPTDETRDGLSLRLIECVRDLLKNVTPSAPSAPERATETSG